MTNIYAPHLDLFNLPPTQTQVSDGVWDTIKAESNYSTGTVTFEIKGSSNQYLNLAESELQIRCQVVNKTTGKKVDLKESKLVGVVNNFMSSIFNQVQVKLNNVPSENSNSYYAYRAYIENLLNHSEEAKKTYLQNCLFVKDVAEHVDKLRETNTAIDTRIKCFDDESTIYMCGRIHSDIFNTERYMLNSVDVSLILGRSSDSFALLAAADQGYQIKITEANLLLRRQELSPALMLEHSLALEKTNAKYPIRRVVMNNYSLPVHSSNFQISRLHTGAVPQRLIVGFVLNTAFAGEIKENPFNFQHFHLTSMKLKLTSRATPYSEALTFDYDKLDWVQGYNTLFQNIRRAPNGITYTEYAKGNALYAFDLSSDLIPADYFHVVRDGNLDIDLSFKKPNDKGITMLTYMEFDSIIEITKKREVFFDYKS